MANGRNSNPSATAHTSIGRNTEACNQMEFSPKGSDANCRRSRKQLPTTEAKWWSFLNAFAGKFAENGRSNFLPNSKLDHPWECTTDSAQRQGKPKFTHFNYAYQTKLISCRFPALVRVLLVVFWCAAASAQRSKRQHPMEVTAVHQHKSNARNAVFTHHLVNKLCVPK